MSETAFAAHCGNVPPELSAELGKIDPTLWAEIVALMKQGVTSLPAILAALAAAGIVVPPQIILGLNVAIAIWNLFNPPNPTPAPVPAK